MESTKMLKVDRPFECINENETIVLSEDGTTIISLNQISFFLWKNCNNKDLCQLTNSLIEQCNNNKELEFASVYQDNIEAIKMLAYNGLVRFGV